VIQLSERFNDYKLGEETAARHLLSEVLYIPTSASVLLYYGQEQW
jgi:hypothetical protein